MSSSPEFAFSQIQGLAERTLLLRRDRVVIIDKIGDQMHERHVPLSDISPSVETIYRRFNGPTVVLIVFAGIFAYVSWNVAGPSHLSDALQGIFGYLAVICLMCTYITYQPIAVARVKNMQGDVLFEMYRRKEVALSFEEFLLQLQRRIQALES